MSEETREPRRKVGRYEIESELGRGTMGVVYRAIDPVLGRPIALKTILLDHLTSETREAFERRFLAEARTAARLSHPGIVVVHDFGRDPDTGILYIALECLAGETLAIRLVEGRAPDWRESLRIVGSVAAALHHAHSRGVVHRDIKPANIMILPNGDPKIMDFGIAHVEQAEPAPNDLAGTPLYMSPEQALGEPVDGRSDIFSLGSIAYALLTGRPPFRAGSVRGILARVAYQQPPRPTDEVPTLPREIDRILAHAMAKTPEARHHKAGELAEDIDDLLSGQPPRHSKDQVLEAPGEATVVSRRGLKLVGEIEDLQMEALEASVPWPPRQDPVPPTRHSWRLVALLALFALAVSVYLHREPGTMAFWRSGTAALLQALAPGQSAERTDTLPAIPPPVPHARPLPAAGSSPPLFEVPSHQQPLEFGPATSAEAVPSPAAETNLPPEKHLAPPTDDASQGKELPEPSPPPTSHPTPEASLEPQKPSAKPSPAPTAVKPTKAAPSARLRVEFAHNLKSGTLRLWVDGAPKLNERLTSQTKRRLIVFETREGRVVTYLELPTGVHELRAQVDSGGSSSSGRLKGGFREGQTRLLGVELKGGRLGMAWR